MSKELQELEDKLLFDEVNRRVKLLATVQGGHPRSEWYRLIILIPLGVVACTLVWHAFNLDEIVALSMIASVMISLSGIYEATVDARMDALVRLLQEDGILRETPPGVKHPDQS